jgi:hypothetical protein
MRYRTNLRTLPLILCCCMPVLAQQTPPSQEVLEQDAHEQQALEQDAAIEHEPSPSAANQQPPLSSHATVEASPELGGLAAREPEQFIGKKLILTDGSETKPVGPVLAVRTQLKDQRVYLIVNATEYFNSPTQFAVAVANVDRIEGENLITPAAPGMHLLGQQYYAGDYADLPKPIPTTPDD